MTEVHVLIHHGVKGQQWGVQHGPPYPIQQGAGVTIKMGAKFSRLSQYDETTAKGHAYVTYLKSDVDHYKGFFSIVLKRRNPKEAVRQHTLVAKKDLKSPDLETRKKNFRRALQKRSQDQKRAGKLLSQQSYKISSNFLL